MSTTIQSKKTITCSACGKTGHNKSSPKYHPIVPKEVSLLTAHQIRQKEEMDALSSTIQSNRNITCSACGKTGHNKSSPKYHPIVPKEVPLLTAHQIRQKEEMDALMAKHALENLEDIKDIIEPTPAPVFLPRKHRGECGLENGEIHFPLTHMGCSEDARGLVMTVTIQFNQSRVSGAIIKPENDP